jgi:hypothetical protein
VFGEDRPIITRDLLCLAKLAHANGDNADAEQFYRRMVKVDELWFGPNDLRVEWDLNTLADFLMTTGNLARAKPASMAVLRSGSTATPLAVAQKSSREPKFLRHLMSVLLRSGSPGNQL